VTSELVSNWYQIWPISADAQNLAYPELARNANAMMVWNIEAFLRANLVVSNGGGKRHLRFPLDGMNSQDDGRSATVFPPPPNTGLTDGSRV